MSDNICELEFESFIKAGFDGKELHPLQIQELKRAFHGGITIGCFSGNKKDIMIKECKDFFDTEVVDD